MKEFILKAITEGITAVELAEKIIAHSVTYNLNWKYLEIMEILKELLDSGEIIELVYILPDGNYTCKTMIFPKGTKIQLNKREII